MQLGTAHSREDTQKGKVTIPRQWIWGATSVRGTGHLSQNLPNQDAWHVVATEDGAIIAAVVSDGAGSAPRSAEGSRACVQIMADALLRLGQGLSTGKRSPSTAKDAIYEGILEIRAALDATGFTLREFHHTLTGAVLSPTGGLIVQIGDSPAILTQAGPAEDQSGVQGIDYFAQYEILDEEKSGYANETHFVTQDSWQDNLRIHPISTVHGALLLMSDGAGKLAIARGNIFRPFASNVIYNFLAARDMTSRSRVLEESVADSKADGITNDDKTLVVICPDSWLAHANHPNVTDPVKKDALALELAVSDREQFWLQDSSSVPGYPAGQEGHQATEELSKRSALTRNPQRLANDVCGNRMWTRASLLIIGSLIAVFLAGLFIGQQQVATPTTNAGAESKAGKIGGNTVDNDKPSVTTSSERKLDNSGVVITREQREIGKEDAASPMNIPQSEQPTAAQVSQSRTLSETTAGRTSSKSSGKISSKTRSNQAVLPREGGGSPPVEIVEANPATKVDGLPKMPTVKAEGKLRQDATHISGPGPETKKADVDDIAPAPLGGKRRARSVGNAQGNYVPVEPASMPEAVIVPTAPLGENGK